MWWETRPLIEVWSRRRLLRKSPQSGNLLIHGERSKDSSRPKMIKTKFYDAGDDAFNGIINLFLHSLCFYL